MNRDIVIDVPYLAQTEALCGGAAAAMAFRYWGDTHADVQEFASIVDRRAGGIAQDALVSAVATRGWRAQPLVASVQVVREHLAAGEPLILLLEERPGRYHYVLAVGVKDDHILVHDPAWGPFRRYSATELERRWKPAGFWALLVRPGDSSGSVSISADDSAFARPPETACTRRLADAVAAIRQNGFGVAETRLDEVRRDCPDLSDALSELSAIRFSQGRLDEAVEMAAAAVAKNPGDRYGWTLLASARFLQDDTRGALRAWNTIQQPRIDRLEVTGVSRTRQALIADWLNLWPNDVLTEDRFLLAERRLDALPDQAATRMRLLPQQDGSVVVEAAVAEQSRRPSGYAGLSVMGARAAINREIQASVPGWTGQGEVWTFGWRWWEERPRLGMSLAAPSGWGVWTVEGASEVESYAAPHVSGSIRETQTSVSLGLSDWLTPSARYEVQVGAASWSGDRRTLLIGGLFERRFAADRIVASASVQQWLPVNTQTGFRSAGTRVFIQSTTEPRGFTYSVTAEGQVVTRDAPLFLWPGAGTGHARAPLLRAHPLLRDGIIASPAFGRQLLALNFEAVRWVEKVRPLPTGLAAFVDIGRAFNRIVPADMDMNDPAVHLDAGGGLRIRIPGDRRVLRLDYAYGIRDGRHAVSIGWLDRPHR